MVHNNSEGKIEKFMGFMTFLYAGLAERQKVAMILEITVAIM